MTKRAELHGKIGVNTIVTQRMLFEPDCLLTSTTIDLSKRKQIGLSHFIVRSSHHSSSLKWPFASKSIVPAQIRLLPFSLISRLAGIRYREFRWDLEAGSEFMPQPLPPSPSSYFFCLALLHLPSSCVPAVC